MTVDQEHLTQARRDVMAQAQLPAWERIDQKARNRRRRTRTSFAAAGVALVAVSAVGAVDVKAHLDRDRGAIASVAQALPAQTNRCGVYPSSEKEIYVIYSGERSCFAGAVSYLTRTVDGGRTWQTWQVPANVNCDGAPLVTPLASGTAVMCDLITHDSGETWDTLPAGRPVVEAVPAGWIVLPGTSITRSTGQLTVIDPVTGRRALLAHSLALPGGEELVVTVNGWPRLNSDGSIWAMSSQLALGRGRISLDRGRTWHTVTLPGHRGNGTNSELTTYDGRVGYIVADDSEQYVQILRTTDGGRSWQPMARQERSDELLATAAGGLIAMKATGPELSTDGGRTFRKLTGVAGVIVRTATGAYFADGSVSVSDDGVHYQRIQPPR
ncbi:WD40/YVTN/BNR-like repeat-containing protein [Fodinicola acaciae]|uniref:WD40/YVTN/BNR-like repeat-containing protein n=1 Tax=Fodinicola acaciae TaxID=2681555 RepID=UPI0013D85052|nr:hypothetical protein [Fodinicola acaciae]